MTWSSQELHRLYRPHYPNHTQPVETPTLHTPEHEAHPASPTLDIPCGTDQLLIASAVREAAAKHSRAAARTPAVPGTVTPKENLSPTAATALYDGFVSWEKLITCVCLFVQECF